jgi:hypothetical protein
MTFPDCCGTPRLTARRTLYESVHNIEAILQCEACQAFWFYRFSERINWEAGRDDQTSWYTRLNDEHEADGDRVFLRTRPSWMDDNGNIVRVAGAPEGPWH